ncbi:family 78 glycoside hydrolase catalytic domain [uncultured Trichococcus sp.]|uniref:alpha-L-rhamnosidase n=1 Tax=uncultured Trichococcus sp. TaxID=189665 RepID=UPI0029C667D2|nr:family 78 glycoside hydrolase catalytic domain [uncultured Trichococcus sp.]
MNTYNLKTNHILNPIGFSLDALTLSWITEAPFEEELLGTRVIIALDENFEEVIHDSGMQADLDHLCYQPEIKLQPRTRYFWKVITKNAGGEEFSSEIQYFETAKEEEHWTGKWIEPARQMERMPLVRKLFRLPAKSIREARVYATGLGIYELYLNGKKIGDEYLAPGFHSYDFWQQYQTYDITEALQAGGNAIGFMLGDGWYKGRFGFDGGYEDLYGDQFRLIAECIVTYEDGTEEIIATDDTWEVAEGPLVSSSIYDGEVYDANLEIHGWNKYSEAASDVCWEPMQLSDAGTEKLQARLSVPVKIVDAFVPELILTPVGEQVLDFKQNMTGWITFTADVPKGTVITYEVGEVLQEGNFYRDNLRTAEAKFTYISNGKPAEVRPYFTFYGFRYAKITGVDLLEKDFDFKGYVLQSELEETSGMITANPDVNQLLKNALWGQKGNFLDVPTDCPQRDERMGWTGDAQIFARTASYHMYTPAFYKKFMHDLRLEQKALDGAVPFVVPQIKPEGDAGFVTGAGAAAWSDAATVIPWVLYEQYGDRSLLKEHYPTMKDWVDYIVSEDTKSGGKRLWTSGFQFGDWLALDGDNPHSPMGGTDTSLVASVYYYHSASLLARSAEVLGYTGDALAYTKLASEVKQAIQNEYLTATGRLAVTTQTAYILFHYFDLCPEPFKERMTKDFYDKVISSGVHLQTGFVGTPYFAEALSKTGMNELAYGLLLNEDYPSWLFAVKMGATTIWERWNSILPDGKISGTDMNSLNHYAYGSIVEWLYRCVLGIQADSAHPGYKHFFLAPQPSAQLGKAEGYYQSVSGRIESAWEILVDGQLDFAFRVPFGTTATITLPDMLLETAQKTEWLRSAVVAGDGAKVTVPAGEYRITYMPTRNYRPEVTTELSFRELLEYTPARKVIFEQLPMMRNNDIALQYLDMPMENFKDLPIVSNFVSEQALERMNASFA